MARQAIALGVGIFCVLGCQAPVAQAATAATHHGGAQRRPHSGSSRSPSGPPLVSGSSAYATPGQSRAGSEEGVEVEGRAAESEADPLVENGLGSPLCTEVGAGLSPAAIQNCKTSDFVATPVPSPNYAFDVNIPSGLILNLAGDFQNFILRPPWTMFVWGVHYLLIGIEWSFTFELLNGPTLSALSGLLRHMQHTVTQPWLALVLAIAAVAIAWRGIVRRQAAASLGDALAIVVLTAAGLVMILDPLGTVGRLVSFADGASLQTFAAVTGGSTSHPDSALAEGIGQLFADTVNAPWCYMEFGNVAWCDQPSELDPTLRAAALKVAERDSAEAKQSGPRRAEGLNDSATLLRAARTNGAIFLAQTANGFARNEMKEGSLLVAICKSKSLESCKGQAASEAQFRTNHHTIDRIVGLVIICCGGLGAFLLFGFVLIRLLSAAVLGLIFLLVAPAAALMPALGEGGRSAFRDWAGHLLGAIAAKLVWSFLLGVLLESMKALLLLGGLGWWLQWLLMSVLWWGTFHHRHRLLAITSSFSASESRRTGFSRGGSPFHYLRRGRRAVGRAFSAGKGPYRMLRRYERWRDERDELEALEDPKPFKPAYIPKIPKPKSAREAVARQTGVLNEWWKDADPAELARLYTHVDGPSEEVMAYRRKLVEEKRERMEEGAAELAKVVAQIKEKGPWDSPVHQMLYDRSYVFTQKRMKDMKKHETEVREAANKRRRDRRKAATAEKRRAAEAEKRAGATDGGGTPDGGETSS